MLLDYDMPAPFTEREAHNISMIIRASRVWTATLAGGESIRAQMTRHDGDPLPVQFFYTNWRGDVYDYLILPESVEFGRYDNAGRGPDPCWVLHGQLISRDGDPRVGVGGNRRRTFLLDGISNLRLLDGGFQKVAG